LRQTITNTGFNLVHCFVSALDLKLFFVSNYNGKNIYVYNEYWEYQRTITPGIYEYPISGPTNSMNINGSIYILTDNVINKYDSNFILIKQFNISGSNRGIYYNSSNQMIYIGKLPEYGISVYNKDFIFTRTISTNYTPFFITEYKAQLVATDNNGGNIYFYQGDSLNKTITTNCNSRITAVLFDNYNQMLVLCEFSNPFIYNVNGAYTGLQVPACNNTRKIFVNFDSKDRLVFICEFRIEIFY
jgi:hypothetical protein